MARLSSAPKPKVANPFQDDDAGNNELICAHCSGDFLSEDFAYQKQRSSCRSRNPSLSAIKTETVLVSVKTQVVTVKAHKCWYSLLGGGGLSLTTVRCIALGAA